jgi:hypothetical protein
MAVLDKQGKKKQRGHDPREMPKEIYGVTLISSNLICFSKDGTPTGTQLTVESKT